MNSKESQEIDLDGADHLAWDECGPYCQLTRGAMDHAISSVGMIGFPLGNKQRLRVFV